MVVNAAVNPGTGRKLMLYMEECTREGRRSTGAALLYMVLKLYEVNTGHLKQIDLITLMSLKWSGNLENYIEALEIKLTTLSSDPDPDPPIPPDFVSNTPKLLVNKVVGGFKVSKHQDYDGILNGFSIAVGYRKRRGNAIKGYHPNDFDLQTNIGVSIKGVRMTTSSSNKSEFIVLSQTFEVKFTGFDENRDLVIDAKAQV